MDYVMFQNIDKNLIYYGVYRTESETLNGSDILCSVRKRFFETGQKQKGRGNMKTDSEIYNYSYIMEDGVSLRYRKLKKDGKQLERVFDTAGGYFVETLNEKHKPVKKAFFDKRHQWIKTDFVSPVDKTVIYEVFPTSDGDKPALIFKSKNVTNKLYPFNISLDKELTEKLNIMTNEPEIFCVTNKGSFYFCTQTEHDDRRNALEKIIGKAKQNTAQGVITTAHSLDVSKLGSVKKTEFDLSESTEIYVSSDIKEKHNETNSSDGFFSKLESIAQQSIDEKDIVSEFDLMAERINDKFEMRKATDFTEKNEQENEPDIHVETKEETKQEEKIAETVIESTQKEIESNTDEVAEHDKNSFSFERSEKNALYERRCAFTQECPYETIDKQIIESDGRQYFYFGGLNGSKRNGKGRTAMKNGETAYEGKYVDDKRGGFGVYYYKSGKLCYVGNWKDNKRDGLGVAFSPTDGSAFIGEWKDNNSINVGAAFDSKGKLLYVGNVDNDKKHGAGITYNEADRTFFVGKYKDGEFLCTGTQFSSEGNLLYTGEYKYNQRNGTGTSYNDDGTVRYQGEWLNSLYSGEGILYLEDGGMLKGTFKSGKAYGKGTLTDKNGKVIYVGSFVDDVYNGTGRLFSDNGGYAEGRFIDGEPTGIFNEYTSDKKLIYCGEWTDMHRNGRGIEYKDGEKIYEGEFRNSLYNGEGKQLYNGNAVYIGTFVNGKRNGYGVEFKDNETYYQGMWKDNLYNGSGILFDDGEARYVGIFRDGKMNGRINEISEHKIIRKSIYEDDTLIYMCEYSKDGAMLYYGSVSGGMRNGMGCTFISACEKQFEGIFRNNEPEKAMKVFLRELSDIPPCSCLDDTEYELYRKTPEFIIEKNITVGEAQGIYTGKMKNGLPDGEGTILYADHRYTGIFINGKPEGTGIIYMRDGEEKRGKFSTNPFAGCQTLILTDIKYYYLEKS